MNESVQVPSAWTPIDLAREPEFELGRLRVRPSRLEVEAEGRREVLQRRTMQVLIALARSASSVVSHEELNARCWAGLTVGEDAVTRCIGQLRRLAQGWSPPIFDIVTIVGVGYRLEAESVLQDEKRFAPRALAPSWKGRMGVALAALLLVALSAAILAWRASQAPAPALTLAAFEPLGASPHATAVAQAVDTELLGAFNANQIPVRTATKPLPALIGHGSGLTLAGSVEDRGEDAHATARLINLKTGTVIWSAGFDRPASEVNALPVMLAAQAADMVAIARFAQEGPKPVKDDAAIAAVLAAHDALEWNGTFDWARRIELARRVTQMAPDFAFGHSMLSWADTSALRIEAAPAQTDALATEARHEAEYALKLDPDDAGSYFALAMQQTDIAGREAILSRGLSRPGHPRALQAAVNEVKSNSLLSTGRVHDALPFADRALALNPLSPTETSDALKAYALAGRVDYSRDLLAKALQRWPEQPDILEAQLYLLTFFGGEDEALRLVGETGPRSRRNPEATAIWRAYLNAKASGVGQARKEAAEQVNALTLQGRFNPRIAILMLAQLGDLDGAFAIMMDLRHDISEVSGFQYAPAAAPLRSDPRFIDFATRSGLVQYWRNTHQVPDLCEPPAAERWCAAIGAHG